MEKSILSKVRGAVKGFLPFYLFTFLLLLSCAEETEVEGEWDNWEERNEAVIDQWAANNSYRKILTFTRNTNTPGLTNSDYIYVEVLEAGNSVESPLYTDTVRVAYRGRFIPTVSYPDGKVFDQSYEDEFSWKTAKQTDFVASGLVDGFTTALMNMHKGDRWRVYLPYTLGYGTSSTTTILGYSNLIFDIALYDFWHPGEKHPSAKSR